MFLSKKMLVVLFCTAIGGIIRILYCWKYPIPVRDSYKYYETIQQWNLTQNIPNSHFPPLGLYIMRLPSIVFNNLDVLKGGIILNVVLGLLLIILTIHLSYYISNSYMIALISGIIVATHPMMVELSCQMLRENSYLICCILFAYCMLKYLSNNKKRNIISASFFSTCAVLCRFEALELSIILVVLILTQKKLSAKRKIADFMVFNIICIISFFAITHLIDIPLSYYKEYISYLFAKC